ncbi:phytoene desaturase family protein [Streptomyces sp. TR06-5]|uniref:phytoene desaturase family protein n=1 Tax=unclassified Streptomyces TaxID=2593676 RepID=UPI0039A32D38
MAGIAVIGSGTGAMAAAARLATAGHRVTVLEANDTYGGALRRYERDGFAFDTGPGLLHLPAVHRDLFLKTGRRGLEDCVDLRRVDPDARHVFADGTGVTLPGFSHGGVAAALDSALGSGSGAQWQSVLGRAATTWDATRRPLLEEPLHEDAPVPQDPYPVRRRRGLLRRRPPTLARVAADELRDPRLAALLCGSARSHGIDPARAPASAAVLAHLEQTFGTWYVRGGMRELARALHDRCRERGVEFRFGTRVAGVREASGAVTGVALADGEELDADAVVAPGSPRPDAPGVRSRFTVLLALRGARPEGTPHRTLLHDAGGRLLTVLRPGDPALVPDEDHESAVLTVSVPPGPVAAPERTARELIARADAAGLGLGPRLLWWEAVTPADYAIHTGSPGGAVPPPALAGDGGEGLRDANLPGSPSGLFRAGGWAHPGGGLAHAGMSGALAAGLLVEGKDWRGSA